MTSKIATRVAARYLQSYGDPGGARQVSVSFPPNVDVAEWWQANSQLFDGLPWLWEPPTVDPNSNSLVVLVYVEGMAGNYTAPLKKMLSSGVFPAGTKIFGSPQPVSA